MHLGRERPPPNRSGTGSGGWQRGSLTPPLVADGDADTGTDKDAGGIERRPETSREAEYRQ